MLQKTVKLGNQEVTFKSSAAIPRMYRVKFGRDIFKDLSKLEQAYKANVGKEFEFKGNGHLAHRLAGLRKAWCLARWGCKVNIAQASAAAFEQSDKLAVLHNIAKELPCFGVICYGTTGHINYFAFAVGTCTLVYAAVLPVAGKHVALVF